MSILTTPLPTTVKIAGIDYPINTDFRAGITFETLMQGEEDDTNKILKALELYYGGIPSAPEEAIEKMLWFYRGGTDEESDSSGGPQAYSFEEDADFISAAFLDQYQIDLTDVEMHWWKFRALMSGLTDKNRIVEIMGYRTVKISNEMSKGQKQFYQKMKKAYRLNAKKGRRKPSALEKELM
ncbi:MAG: bacteriophage Gp15 family protein [Lachnospiraceae bacterium]